MQKYSFNIGIWAMAAIVVVLSQVGALDLYIQSVIMFIGINIILSSSLNVVNGYMGEFFLRTCRIYVYRSLCILCPERNVFRPGQDLRSSHTAPGTCPAWIPDCGNYLRTRFRCGRTDCCRPFLQTRGDYLPSSPLQPTTWSYPPLRIWTSSAARADSWV